MIGSSNMFKKRKYILVYLLIFNNPNQTKSHYAPRDKSLNTIHHNSKKIKI